jgi:hypothetical protein
VPILIPAIVGAAVGTGIAVGTGAILASAAIGFFATSFATSLVLTGLAKLLAPNAPSIDTMSLSRTQTLRSPIGSRQIVLGQARVGGQLTFATIDFIDFGVGVLQHNVNRTLGMIITLAGHEVEEIGDVWFDNEVVPITGAGVATGHYADYALIKKRLGTADDTAFEDLLARGVITANMRQRGCAKIMVRLSKNNDLYTNGMPNITAVVKGAKCYDPRTGLTVWTSNAALCINYYLCLPKVDGGFGVDYASEVNETKLIAAANSCDELVALAAGGSEKRYTINGAFLVSADPKSVLQAMLAAMAGTCVCVGGKWELNAGVYQVPTVTLTESHARGPIKTQTRLSRAEIFNGVKGTYVAASNNWQPTDFVPVVNSTYLLEDNNERLWKDVQFQFVSSHATAQRLAKIELERSRQQITEQFPANLMGLQVQAGDTVYRSSVAKGWVNKPFEVIESKFVIYSDAGGAPALGVDLVLRETAATVFDWNSGNETVVDAAPNSSLANPFSPVAPGIVSVVESLYATTGSAGVKSRVTVTLGLTLDGTSADYSLEYSVTGLNAWAVLPLTKDSVIRIDDLAPNTYDFRARSFNGLGVASSYSAIFKQQTFGLSAPPGNVQNLTVRAFGGQAMVTLTQAVDLDVRQGGRLILRWSPKTAGANWNDGSLLSPPDSAVGPAGWPGDSVMVMAPLYGGTYLAKFRDSTGNYSVTEASFVVAESLLTALGALASVVESPTFTGVKTGLAAVDAALQLDGTVLWDSLGLVDSLTANIDSLGGLSGSGSYLFANAMNVGSIKTARLYPSIASLAFDTLDTWDDRTSPIDSWGLIDGAVIEDAEVTLYVRITSDDPAGAPTWGPWHPLQGPADYTFWGAQFRLDFVSGNPTHNRKVTTLAVVAKQ